MTEGVIVTRHRLAVAELFYEARLGLTSSAKYRDLYWQLKTAATTLDYSSTETLNLERACQAVNIRNHTPPGLVLKSDGVTTVALLQDSGQLLLKGTLTYDAGTSITTSGGGLILRNDAGTVVAFINASVENGGQMIIGGSLTQNDVPGTTSTLLVVRYEGVPMATLDSSGNLNIWREADYSDDDVTEDWD